MKILHTSDWHLGRSLYGRKRYGEFSAFLNWLGKTIEKEDIDVLLVSGDVFDSRIPGNRAQSLYYRFLCRIAESCCRHVVIIAGNHDSPSFLDAPKELLLALNVHVIGAMTRNIEDEVIVIGKNSQITQMVEDVRVAQVRGNTRIAETSADDEFVIVCAVPYLRDRDIRSVDSGETIDDKNRKLIKGIKNHYTKVVRIAEQKRDEILQQFSPGNQRLKIPIIVMGHLFTAGGKTIDGDGVRELYVGSLAHVDENIFPSSIDYLALGHLHVPQRVGGKAHMRYCGSPIPMGFGEAGQQKIVIIADFNFQVTKNGANKNGANPYQITQNNADLERSDSFINGDLAFKIQKVPCFQPLERIAGSFDEIRARLEYLKQNNSTAWLEIEYTGNNIIGDLKEMLDEIVTGSSMEILRIKNKRFIDRVISTIADNENLDDLNANDVFERCLDAFDVPDEDRYELTASYNEIIRDLIEDDCNAE